MAGPAHFPPDQKVVVGLEFLAHYILRHQIAKSTLPRTKNQCFAKVPDLLLPPAWVQRGALGVLGAARSGAQEVHHPHDSLTRLEITFVALCRTCFCFSALFFRMLLGGR